MPNFREYAEAGWALCALPHAEKGPRYPRWQTEPLPVDACEELPGAGLLHALSGTCALDIDDLATARTWFRNQGVDLDALLEADDAVGISSGRPNRAKLLFRMRRPMTTVKPPSCGFELRCATAQGTSVHDALPPSIHPSGQPYEWTGGLLGDWRCPPPIPGSLLAVWRGLLDAPAVARPIPKADSGTPRVELAKLKRAVFQHDPDCGYDEWIRIGMQLHDATGGAREGLDIWIEWSKGIARAPYPGDAVLRQHYLSFRSAPGKHVATGEALEAELPAEAEDFEIIEPEPKPDPAVVKAEKQSKRDRVKEALAALEKRVAFVVASEQYFDFSRMQLLNSEKTIRILYRHAFPKGKNGRPLDPVPLLEDSPTKQVVDALAFHPGEGRIFSDKVTESIYANSYVDRRPEAAEPTPEELDRIEFLFNRIDDPVFREWLRQFLGHVAQHPGVKINSAPLIWSETQGNGKTTLLKVIPSLLTGKKYSQEVSCSMLNSDFNDYLLGAWHVNLTEFRAGTRGERDLISAKLKAYISDASIGLHPKGSRGYQLPNHFFVTATSNQDDAAAIDNNDRRWAIHELKAPAFTPDEQRWMYDFLNDEKRAAAVLRWYFEHVDLTGFVASAAAPQTQAKLDMAAASGPADVELLRTAFEENAEPFSRDVVRAQDVMQYVHKHSVARPTVQRIAKMLTKAPFNGVAKKAFSKGATYNGIIIRNASRWMAESGDAFVAEMKAENVDFRD